MVGFRYQAKYAADDLGLTGWVCNLCDGRVEMEVQGRDSDIDRLLARLYEARSIRITDIEARRMPLMAKATITASATKTGINTCHSFFFFSI